MYDNPNLPYRCPLCLQPVSPCTEDALTRKKTCGCLTCSCKAPVFTQEEGESIFMPSIRWNNWVIKYRREHPNWHRDVLCKVCINQNSPCKYYDDNYINCDKWRSEDERTETPEDCD